MKVDKSIPWREPNPELPSAFRHDVRPTPVPQPKLVAWSPRVAAELGLDGDRADYLTVLAGNSVPDGQQPYAAGYAGHQFGVWVPELGDGRAITLGTVDTLTQQRFEMQLKGSGMTRWSRMGDGRAVLRSTIREYLGSAAMVGLGIPTTRALSIVTSDLPVYRERTESAAILSRVTHSHVRFGTFQWLASLGEQAARDQLVETVIANHFPTLLRLNPEDRAAAWFGEVVNRTARLMAQWVSVGFAHGVMNTDNFSILGETIDYGPFGWMDSYDPALVCNHSDWEGRYRFDQQPMVGLWNCARLGEALVPLVTGSDALKALEEYRATYQDEVSRLMRMKLGLSTGGEGDIELATQFLELLQVNSADYTRSFRALSKWDQAEPKMRDALASEIGDHEALDAWLVAYGHRLTTEPVGSEARHISMQAANPKYVLRNWVAQEVIQNAETGNTDRIDEVRALLDNPFVEHPGWERYAAKPPEWAREIVVSCSS